MKKLLYVALLAIGVVVMMAPPVMAQEEKPFTIHGEVRFRGEYQNNASDFDDGADDGGLFWPYRVRIAAEGKFTKNVSAWIEFQNASVAGGTDPFGNPPTTHNGIGGVLFNDGSAVEMYQGNLTLDQLWSKNFSLRLGRQEIVAGNELLLGDLDFYAGLSHDGGVGNWKLKKVNLMLWYTRPFEGQVSPALGAGNVSPDQETIGAATGSGTQHFWGGYATWNWKKAQTFDIYLMSLSDRGTGGNFQTVGGRYAHDTTGKGIFYNVEVAMQFGQVASELLSGADVDASGMAVEGWFGYNWKSGKNTHRIFGRLEMATGDDTTSTKNEGFQPLFGDFHNRLGHGDWFRMQDVTTNLGGAAVGGGIQGLSVGYTGYFADRTEFGAAFWDYTLEEQNALPSDKLGTAIDVWYGYNYSRNVNFMVSLSQLSPDDALTGGAGAPSDSVTRLYGQARLRF
jgi:hypothetical protein